MRAVWARLLVVGAAFAVYAVVISGTVSDPAMRRPVPEPGTSRAPAIPEPDGLSPVLDVRLEPLTDSLGTAFALGSGGDWLSARHVTAGCRRIAIRFDDGSVLEPARVHFHPASDLSLLRVDQGRAADAFGLATGRLTPGQHGFHYGYPAGRPAAMMSRLMGSRRMRISGRYRTLETVLAWSEIRRVPQGAGHLAGISGGPVLDTRGRIVGVHVAGSARRGRSYSVAPPTIFGLLDSTGRNVAHDYPGGSSDAGLDHENFARAGQRWRDRRWLGKVLCIVSAARVVPRKPAG